MCSVWRSVPARWGLKPGLRAQAQALRLVQAHVCPGRRRRRRGSAGAGCPASAVRGDSTRPARARRCCSSCTAWPRSWARRATGRRRRYSCSWRARSRRPRSRAWSSSRTSSSSRRAAPGRLLEERTYQPGWPQAYQPGWPLEAMGTSAPSLAPSCPRPGAACRALFRQGPVLVHALQPTRLSVHRCADPALIHAHAVGPGPARSVLTDL
jgi:hypothetical protein